MRSLKWLPLVGLAGLALAGCTKSGVVLGGGTLGHSVQYVRVSRKIEPVNAFKLVKRGAATCYEVQLRNNDLKRKQWEMEYRFQFFDADGRELASATQGWRPLTIGRGELKTISGSCLVPGAEKATVILRKWDRKN